VGAGACECSGAIDTPDCAKAGGVGTEGSGDCAHAGDASVRTSDVTTDAEKAERRTLGRAALRAIRTPLSARRVCSFAHSKGSARVRAYPHDAGGSGSANRIGAERPEPPALPSAAPADRAESERQADSDHGAEESANVDAPSRLRPEEKPSDTQVEIQGWSNQEARPDMQTAT